VLPSGGIQRPPPGKLAFVPVGASGCVDKIGAVTSCSASGANEVTIALRPAGVTLPAGGSLEIATIRIQVIDNTNVNQLGLMAFTDPASVKARFGIPDAMIETVHLGDLLDVVVEAVGGTTVKGRVSAIAPAADAHSRVFDVEVTIANGEGRLRPGMIGTVAIARAPRESRTAEHASLAVPLTAVVRAESGSGQFAVVVVQRESTGDVARLRHVELGHVLGNVISVVKGVSPGERVVVTGATLLVDGEPVKVLP